MKKSTNWRRESREQALQGLTNRRETISCFEHNPLKKYKILSREGSQTLNRCLTTSQRMKPIGRRWKTWKNAMRRKMKKYLRSALWRKCLAELFPARTQRGVGTRKSSRCIITSKHGQLNWSYRCNGTGYLACGSPAHAQRQKRAFWTKMLQRTLSMWMRP